MALRITVVSLLLALYIFQVSAKSLKHEKGNIYQNCNSRVEMVGLSNNRDNS